MFTSANCNNKKVIFPVIVCKPMGRYKYLSCYLYCNKILKQKYFFHVQKYISIIHFIGENVFVFNIMYITLILQQTCDSIFCLCQLQNLNMILLNIIWRIIFPLYCFNNIPFSIFSRLIYIFIFFNKYEY